MRVAPATGVDSPPAGTLDARAVLASPAAPAAPAVSGPGVTRPGIAPGSACVLALAGAAASDAWLDGAMAGVDRPGTWAVAEPARPARAARDPSGLDPVPRDPVPLPPGPPAPAVAEPDP